MAQAKIVSPKINGVKQPETITVYPGRDPNDPRIME